MVWEASTAFVGAEARICFDFENAAISVVESVEPGGGRSVTGGGTLGHQRSPRTGSNDADAGHRSASDR